jgi:hypothetical protein
MFAVELVPNTGAGWLEMAWTVQATLTIIATSGMVMRLLRRQRRLDA